MRALITGGTKGIGRAIALRLAGDAAEILLNYSSDDEAARSAFDDVTAAGGLATLIQADACSLEGANFLAERALAEFGDLDLVVHCAVAAVSGNALGADEAAFRVSVEKNGLSFLWLVRSCAPLLNEGSSAIFLTSGGASRAVPNYAPLGLAKALGEATVRYLAAELAPRGVRVNAVSAGAVDTEALRAMMPDTAAEFLKASALRNPSGRALEPTDVGRAIVALASADASMIQGQVVRVDGGLGLR